MLISDYTEDILTNHVLNLNGNYGHIVFWSGTIPTRDQIIERHPLSGSRIQARDLQQTLIALGNEQVSAYVSANMHCQSIGNTLRYNFTRSPGSIGTNITKTPTFATAFLSAKSTPFESVFIDFMFFGSVGLQGSGADFEMTSLNLNQPNVLKANDLILNFEV